MNNKWLAGLTILLATQTGVVTADAADEKLSAPASATTPKLANGKPNLSGVWLNGDLGFIRPVVDDEGNVVCIVGCRPPTPPGASGDAAPKRPSPLMRKPDRPTYKPEFVAKVQELNERQVEFDPALRCGNPGLPRIGPPDAIVHNENHIAFLYEDLSGSFFRMIPTDGRAHNPDAEETFLGDSVGKWVGDTLVIEAVKFNDETWLIDDGSFHTKGLKVTETLRRNGDSIEYQAIVEDPAVLAEPWHMRPRKLVLSSDPLPEPLPCVEQDLDHMMDNTSHDNAR